MCGRYTLWADEDEIVARFGVDHLLAMRDPSWNIAPGSMVTVVAERLDAEGGAHMPVPQARSEAVPGGGAPPATRGEVPSATAHEVPTASGGRVVREVDVMRWGLLPHWAREGVRPHINARAETVTEKPSFRAAARRRRCLVPANGHYEWEKVEAPAGAGASGGSGRRGRTVPWFFHAPSGGVLAYAGVFEERVDAVTGEVVRGVAILTRPAPDEHGRIHDRCPLVVPEDLWDVWLDPHLTDPGAVRGLIDAVPASRLVARHADAGVGSIRNDGPCLVDAGPAGDSAEDGADRPGVAGDSRGPSAGAEALFDL